MHNFQEHNKKKKKRTKNFYFTQFIMSILGIFIRVDNSWQPLVVVDNVLSVNKTGGVKHCRYCVQSITGIFKA